MWNVALSHIVVKKLLTFQKFVKKVICLWNTSADEARAYSRPEVPSVRAGMWHQIPATTKQFLLTLKGITTTLFYLWYWEYLKYSDVRFFSSWLIRSLKEFGLKTLHHVNIYKLTITFVLHSGLDFSCCSLCSTWDVITFWALSVSCIITRKILL